MTPDLVNGVNGDTPASIIALLLGKKEDKSEKLKRIECHSCHDMGHNANKCPLRKPQVKEPSPVAPSKRLSLLTKIKEVEWYKNEEMNKVVTNELKQLFHVELNALMPIKKLSPGQVTLESHMFVHQKCKSSPMLQMHSLFTALAMYAGLSSYLMAKRDTKGAFIQTPMQGPDVHMKICRKIITC